MYQNNMFQIFYRKYQIIVFLKAKSVLKRCL